MTCGLATAALIAATLVADHPVRIATEGAYPPFSMIEEDGTLTGFDKDIGDEVCLRAHLNCDWVTARFDTLIPGVAAGDYDIVIASLAKTSGRAEIIDFTDTYWATTGTDDFLGKPGAPGIETALIGVQSGTIHADHLAETHRKFRAFATVDELVAALVAGQVDLAYGGWDPGMAADLSEQHGIEALYQETLESDGLYMAVCKGNDALREDVNAALATMWDDGIIDQIADRWLY